MTVIQLIDLNSSLQLHNKCQHIPKLTPTPGVPLGCFSDLSLYMIHFCLVLVPVPSLLQAAPASGLWENVLCGFHPGLSPLRDLPAHGHREGKEKGCTCAW